MSDNKISNAFSNCVSLKDVDFSSLTSISMRLDDIKRTNIAAQDLNTAWQILFNTYCAKYPKNEHDWRLLLKMNKEDYIQTIDEIRMWIAENDVKS